MQTITHSEEHDTYKRFFTTFTTSKAIHLLILIGFIVFTNSLFNGFVMDDAGLILQNQSLHVFNPFSVFQGSMFGVGAYVGGIYYRPLQNLLFSMIFSIAGNQAFFYHFVQLLLHIANSILVFLLFRRYLYKSISFFLATIFLIHPMQSETVSYIACMQDVLYVFWGMLFLLIIPKVTLSGKFVWLPFLFLIASIFSKETGIVFFLIGIVQIYLFESKNKAKYAGFIMASLLLFYIIIRLSVGGIGIHRVDEFSMMRLTFFERLLNIPAMLVYYGATFLWPIHLVEVQSWVYETISFQTFYFPLLLVTAFLGIFGGVSLFIWKITKKYSVLCFFWSWLLLGLGLHMQFFPLDVTVADRWFYFPMIGLLGLLGNIYQNTFAKKINKKAILRVSIFTLLLITIYLLSNRTIVRNNDWKDTKTLAIHDLKYQPDNIRLLSTLGAVYISEKDYPKAVYYLNKSVQLFPYWGVSSFNLAVAYHMSDQFEKAKYYYKKSIANAPNYVSAYENLGILYLNAYSPEEAKSFAEQSLLRFPDNPKLQSVFLRAEEKLSSRSANRHTIQ